MISTTLEYFTRLALNAALLVGVVLAVRGLVAFHRNGMARLAAATLDTSPARGTRERTHHVSVGHPGLEAPGTSRPTGRGRRDRVAEQPVRLGQAHCCACSVVCHHVGPVRLCAGHQTPVVAR